MFKVIWRVLALLFMAFTAFMAGAMVFAASKRRDAVPQDPAADEVNLVASFGPLEFKSESHAFRGGNVTTWFGGGVLDLRDATLDPAGATIHTSAMFGGGALVVPESWNVETHVLGIGGAGDGRAKLDRPEDAPTLRLEGTAVFGGWGIMSERPDKDHEEAATA
jgi:predicted membrane protein